MASADRSDDNVFDIKDPLAAFEEYCQLEMARRRERDPEFRADLYGEARDLVRARLEAAGIDERP
jgi:hypothetical protein